MIPGVNKARTMGRFVAVSTLALSSLLIAVPAATAATLSTSTAATKPFYLALGDSLAAGYQPTDGENDPPLNAATGFHDEGYVGGYARDLAASQGLRLMDIACPGETTKSFVKNPALGGCTKLFKSEFNAPNQLAAAKVFLQGHKGQVSLISIDIGANDLDACATAVSTLSCFTSEDKATVSGLKSILASLKSIIQSTNPKARLVAMNYYDPFLGLTYSPGGVKGTTEAAESLLATNILNAELSSAYKGASYKVANVASAFHINSPLPVTTYNNKKLPADVAKACQLTWMCPTGSTAKDIHPTTAGYRVIAQAFTSALG